MEPVPAPNDDKDGPTCDRQTVDNVPRRPIASNSKSYNGLVTPRKGGEDASRQKQKHRKLGQHDKARGQSQPQTLAQCGGIDPLDEKTYRITVRVAVRAMSVVASPKRARIVGKVVNSKTAASAEGRPKSRLLHNQTKIADSIKKGKVPSLASASVREFRTLA